MTTAPQPLPFTWRFAGLLLAISLAFDVAYERVRHARWPEAEFVLLFAAGWFFGFVVLRWWWRGQIGRAHV